MIDRIQDTYDVLQQREMRILECTKGKFLGRTVQLLWIVLQYLKSA